MQRLDFTQRACYDALRSQLLGGPRWLDLGAESAMCRHDLASRSHEIGEDRWVDGQPCLNMQMSGAVKARLTGRRGFGSALEKGRHGMGEVVQLYRGRHAMSHSCLSHPIASSGGDPGTDSYSYLIVCSLKSPRWFVEGVPDRRKGDGEVFVPSPMVLRDSGGKRKTRHRFLKIVTKAQKGSWC